MCLFKQGLPFRLCVSVSGKTLDTDSTLSSDPVLFLLPSTPDFLKSTFQQPEETVTS